MATRSRGRPHETDIPPSEPEALTQARLPGPPEDQVGPQAARPTPPQGSQPPGRDGPQEIERATAPGHRFPRGARISSESEIRALYRQGRRLQTTHLDVFVADSAAARTRVALVVPKHGRTIVERNRLRRRLRESARVELLPRCRERDARLDLLVRARRDAYAAEFAQLRDEIRGLAEQLCSHASS